ncbi:MAG: efflux RND transporter periplasmic adaptor subunit [Saprospiraceae bacterium]
MKKTTIVTAALYLFFTFFLSCKPEIKTEHDVEHGGEHETMLTLPEQDKLLAGIKSDSAVIKNISELTTLVGKTAFDERLVNVLTSRLKGRLDRLYIRTPGGFVKKGQPVYAIYSEALLADENDYLLALDQFEQAVAQKEIAQQLLDAARNKLSLWTLSKEQIEALETSRVASPLMEFYSPYSGYLVELNVREGEYVDIGTPILKTAGLQTLWVETQVYSDEVKYLSQNPSLSVEFEAYPNELFTGEVVFDNPLLEESQKVNLVRLKVGNRGGRLRPGMMAYVYLQRNQKKTLVIPKSALLLESAISVWVETPDGMYEQRMVTTGIENKREVEITSGLRAGEKVVVSGAYFLKSENTVRQGGGSMGGMQM